MVKNKFPSPDGNESRPQKAGPGSKQTLWNELELPDSARQPEDLAPGINSGLLKLLAQNRLPAPLVRALLTLTEYFSSWERAYLEALLEQQKH